MWCGDGGVTYGIGQEGAVAEETLQQPLFRLRFFPVSPVFCRAKASE